MFIIRREASCAIVNTARRRRVLTISGPRGSGKTTLAGILFPQYGYVSLENPEALEFARKRPKDFLRHYHGDLVIDEFRFAPELVNHIWDAAADDSRKGRFILLTSYRQLKKSASAPWVRPAPKKYAATLYLLPLSIRELAAIRVGIDRDECICRGFMPGIFTPGADPGEMYRNYYNEYIERGVRHLIDLDDMSGFGRFMRLMAGRVGQIMSYRSLAEEVGVSEHTLSSWVFALESSHIMFRLPSYFESFGRRLVKNPKFYFTDVGLAANLLGLDSPGEVFRDPQVGNLFENMVIAEALKIRYNRGRGANLYYYRNRTGLEVDLVLGSARGAFPVEIKASSSFDSSLARNIELFRRLSSRIRPGCVVYSGDERAKEGDVTYVNFKDLRMVMYS